MADSNAKKIRKKRIREGKTNPEINRGTWGDIKPFSRKTKTKREKIEHLNNKYKKTKHRYDYD